MSAGFRAVQWNRAKLVYDGILLAGVVLYIGAYLTLMYWLDPPKDQLAAIDLRIRAFGSCAFFMLTVILSIGPLTRQAMLMRSINETTRRMNRNQMIRRKTLRKTRSSPPNSAIMLDWIAVVIDASLG